MSDRGAIYILKFRCIISYIPKDYYCPNTAPFHYMNRFVFMFSLLYCYYESNYSTFVVWSRFQNYPVKSNNHIKQTLYSYASLLLKNFSSIQINVSSFPIFSKTFFLISLIIYYPNFQFNFSFYFYKFYCIWIQWLFYVHIYTIFS